MNVSEGDMVTVYNRTATVTGVYSDSVWVRFVDGSPRKTPVVPDCVTPLEVAER